MPLRLRKPKWNEKRDTARLELECPAGYALQVPKGLFKSRPDYIPGMISKPSLKGLRLLCDEEIPVDRNLPLRIDLKALNYSQSCHLTGRVCWARYSGKTKKFEHGIELSDKSADIKLWRKFIMEQSRGTPMS